MAIEHGRARDPAELLNTVVGETQKVPSRLWRELFTGFFSAPDPTPELRRVSVPTLIVWGDRDTYALRAAQDRLLEVIPGARLLAYEGAGHAIHWEDPGRFAGDLTAFVTLTCNKNRRVGPGEQPCRLSTIVCDISSAGIPTPTCASRSETPLSEKECGL